MLCATTGAAARRRAPVGRNVGAHPEAGTVRPWTTSSARAASTAAAIRAPVPSPTLGGPARPFAGAAWAAPALHALPDHPKSNVQVYVMYLL